MSIHAPTPNPNPRPVTLGASLFVFGFMTVMAVGFLGAALALGTEPRMVFERVEARTFRVTGSNHFAGRQFFTKTIEGVSGVVMDDAVRDGRHDSERENRKRRRQKHLEFFGADRARLGWDRGAISASSRISCAARNRASRSRTNRRSGAWASRGFWWSSAA